MTAESPIATASVRVATALQASFPERCITPQPCPKVRDLIDTAVSVVLTGMTSFEDTRKRVNLAAHEFFTCDFTEQCRQDGAVALISQDPS